MQNNPFVYPQSRHVRKQTPGNLKKYREYKPALQEEYFRKCVYCRVPDSIKGYDSFGVDHYRPKSVFPELVTDYLNLFYCCNSCNRLKTNKWFDPAISDIFVPNPDLHVMWDHLRFKGETVAAVSKAGEFTRDLLQLNEENTVRLRRTVIESLQALEHRLREFENAQKAIQRAFKLGEISENVRNRDLTQVAKSRQKVQDAIDELAGR